MTDSAMSKTPARRPGGRTARVSDRVLRAALQLLGEQGVDGLQYDDVALRAGVGRATVYRRWPAREDLVHDALAHLAEQSIPLETTDDIADDLTAFVEAVASTTATPEGRAVLQLTLRQNSNDRLRQAGLRLLDERLVDLQRRIDAAAELGQLPRVDAAFLNQLLVGPVHLFLLRETTPFTRENARRIVAIVIAGLRDSEANPR